MGQRVDLQKSKMAWAIKITGSPIDNYRTHVRGVPDHPCHTMLFETRREARAWLAEYKESSKRAFNGRWAEHGGTRVYKSARVVRANIIIQTYSREAINERKIMDDKHRQLAKELGRAWKS